MHELKEKINSLDERILQLKETSNNIQEEIRKCNRERNDMKDVYYQTYGKFGDRPYFLTPARTLIHVSYHDINFETSPPTISYSVYGDQQNFDSASVVPETTIEQRIQEGVYIPYDKNINEKEQPIKQLAKSINFQDVRQHKDDIFIGITARKKQMIVFRVNSAYIDTAKDEKTNIDKYALRHNSRYTTYTLVDHPKSRSKEDKYYHRKRRRGSLPSVDILKVCDSKEELVAYLI